MRIELHKRVFLNFVLVIALFGILGSMVGARLISRTTLNEAQRRVSLDLRSAWSVLQSELDKLALYVSVLGTGKRIKDAYAAPDSQAYRASLEAVRRQCGFDFDAFQPGSSLHRDRQRLLPVSPRWRHREGQT